MGVLLFIFAYILGGFTLIPGLIYLYFVHLPNKQPNDLSDLKIPHQEEEPIRAGEIEEKQKSGLDAYKEGWIMVTTEYQEMADDVNQIHAIQDQDTRLAYLTLYKIAQKDQGDDGSSIPHPPQRSTSGLSLGDSTDRKHRYYAVLKHGNLFLYKDERCTDVKHVIVLSNHFVTLWPGHMLELALFTKYSAIAVIPQEFMPMIEQLNQPPPRKAAFYIYCDYNIDKEDWWFALIQATKMGKKLMVLGTSFDPEVHAKTLHFDTQNMIDLISTLYSNEGQLQTKWLNALLGRVFLGLQKTNTIHDWLYTKLLRKLHKIKKPGFMDEFKITHIYPGNSAPQFSYPQLKEINPDGTVIILTYLSYTGSMLGEISTKMQLALGGVRLNKRDVDVTLKITLQKFSGPMLIKIKPPPSERIWYTYEVEPQMELKIEPVVLSRQLLYTFVTNLIHKKFEDAIRELLVLPHWDDMTFYDTQNEVYRGGIWDKTEREQAHNVVAVDHPMTEDANSIKSEPAQLEPKPLSRSLSIATKESKDSGSFREFTESILEEPTEAPPLKIQMAASRAQVKAQAMKNKLRSSKSFTMDGLVTMGAQEDKSASTGSDATTNTLKKIGKWYFKDEKPPSPAQEKDYTPPQMISNRRGRKSSNISQSDIIHERPPVFADLKHKPSYDFGNVGVVTGNGGGDSILLNSNDSFHELEEPPFEELDMMTQPIENAPIRKMLLTKLKRKAPPEEIFL